MVRLRFALGAVALERWQDKQERLGRFFAKGLSAHLEVLDEAHIDLRLLQTATASEPQQTSAGQHGMQ